MPPPWRRWPERASGLETVHAFLRDIGQAWAVATPEERGELIRALFTAVKIDDGRLVAVLPQPALAPFFTLDCQASPDIVRLRKRRAFLQQGRDGGRSRVCFIPVQDTHNAPLVRIRCRVMQCVQQHPRIAPDRWPIVAADARLLGLRQAAKQHGVSHETVRKIMHRVEQT